MKKELILVEAEILDEQFSLTLRELCQHTDISAEFIMDLVAHGLLNPDGFAYSAWRFTAIDYAKIVKAKRLKQDFELNTQALALVMELLEELETLRRM